MIELVLRTGAGFWNPLLFLVSLGIMLLIIYFICSLGGKKYEKDTEQTMPFFSGNPPTKKNMTPSSLYWGFSEAMGDYYAWMEKIHTGVVNDYIHWFILTTVVLLTALTMGGL
jgi:hypothetical protein